MVKWYQVALRLKKPMDATIILVPMEPLPLQKKHAVSRIKTGKTFW